MKKMVSLAAIAAVLTVAMSLTGCVVAGGHGHHHNGQHHHKHNG